jgi:hypothetical protein
MYFPRYWAKATASGPDRNGNPASADAWGWSDVSNDDALQRGAARAAALLRTIPPPRGQPRRSGYYEGRPFREPILQDLSRGQFRTLITRNSFGCEVLNTDRIAFADIDYDPPRTGLLEAMFDFGQKKALARQKTWETGTLERLRQWQRGNPSWSFRVYRTAGGLRLLVTSGLLQAGSPESDHWLEAVGSDPLYLRLCRDQKSFRARLTPKPWRCGLRQLSVRFPWETPQTQQALEKWLKNYQAKCERFAVCEWLETMGAARPGPDLQSAIDWHDARTSVGAGLPLA